MLFIHLPSVFTGMIGLWLPGRLGLLRPGVPPFLADAAARAVAHRARAFTLLGLITGSFWGRPMWGAWWVWDARLTSFLVLFLLFVGYMALLAAIDDETKAARAAAILALVGAVNLPIVHYSVVWWNSLHQGETLFAAGGAKSAAVYNWPIALMSFAYFAGFKAPCGWSGCAGRSGAGAPLGPSRPGDPLVWRFKKFAS